MAAYYLDTSALVKRYASEVGSAWVEALAGAGTHDLYTGRLTAVETVAALTRKARSGGATAADVAQAIAQFRQDWSQEYLVIEMTALVTDRAMDLAQTYGLRGYDAAHLGAACDLQDARAQAGLPALIFVSADTDQREVAALLGLPVDDPQAHP